MARRIVFIGNCQMSILRNLYDRFVTGVTGDDTYFLPTWTALDPESAAALEAADLLVDQVQSLHRNPGFRCRWFRRCFCGLSPAPPIR
jgi:hypothetical protein